MARLTKPPPPKVWRPIEGFPSYEVSECGQVRRWYDMRAKRMENHADFVARGLASGPYVPHELGDVFAVHLSVHYKRKTVGLEKVRDSGKYFQRKVSSLVLAAFPPEAPAAE